MDKKTRYKQQAGVRKKQEAARKLWESRRGEIMWLYHDQMWPQAKLAEHFHVSQTALSKVLKRLSIRSLGRARKGSGNGRFKDGLQSRLYRQMIEKDKCSKCGATDDLVIHHKNGTHTDNRLDNLQVLCDRCHSSHHRRLWWSNKKSRS